MPRVPTDPSSSEPEGDPTARRLQARRQGLAWQGAAEAVFAIPIAAGAGYWLDDRFHKSPIFLLLGTAIGFAAFVRRLVRLGRQLQAIDASGGRPEDTDSPSGPEL
jgi:F0F1-type ATP synthase assembly protein I